MNNNQKWDLFIAHAGRDSKRASSFYEYVSENCHAFLDSSSLSPGDDWDSLISHAQSNSRVTVALISTDIESAYYAREEIATAIALERQNEQAHKVVPLYLDGMPLDITKVPYGLRLKHGVDVLQTGGLKAAAQKVLSIVNVSTRNTNMDDIVHTCHMLHQSPAAQWYHCMIFTKA